MLARKEKSSQQLSSSSWSHEVNKLQAQNRRREK